VYGVVCKNWRHSWSRTSLLFYSGVCALREWQVWGTGRVQARPSLQAFVRPIKTQGGKIIVNVTKTYGGTEKKKTNVARRSLNCVAAFVYDFLYFLYDLLWSYPCGIWALLSQKQHLLVTVQHSWNEVLVISVRVIPADAGILHHCITA